MNGLVIAGGVIVFVLLVYLFVALLFPEKLS